VNCFFVAFRPNDENETAPDWTNCDESVLGDGVLRIKDLEVVVAGPEECAGFFEADFVFSLVREILRFIPHYLHG